MRRWPQVPRDRVLEPHWVGPGWLGKSLAAEWKPVTKEIVARRFIPERQLPCHGEEEQKLGFVTRDGEVVALEVSCAVCRGRVKQAAEEFAFKSDSIDKAATEFLRRNRVRMDRKGFLK